MGDDGGRTFEQIREHYEVEKELAAKLRSASKEERRALYTAVYDELMERVPHHPRLLAKQSARESAKRVESDLGLLRPFLTGESVFLEIGPGDCAVARAVAQIAKHVYAVDVSSATASEFASPENMELVISDGTSIPAPSGAVDVAYSNQLMEHLHPDDAVEQLANVYDALKPGGVYLCITPNRVSGPHDISLRQRSHRVVPEGICHGRARGPIQERGVLGIGPPVHQGEEHLAAAVDHSPL